MSLSIDKDHPVNISAWIGFLNWAIGVEELRQQFTEETGILIPTAPRTPLEAMIDEATGYQDDWMRKYVVWVSEAYWGAEDETPSVIEKFKG